MTLPTPPPAKTSMCRICSSPDSRPDGTSGRLRCREDSEAAGQLQPGITGVRGIDRPDLPSSEACPGGDPIWASRTDDQLR